MSAGLLSSTSFAYPGGRDMVRVGLIGCGGRGAGAARHCVSAAENVELYAMGDLFEDRLSSSRSILERAVGEKCNVSDDRCFVGFDAYKKVIQSDVDLVLLTTPPGFRPLHFREAVMHGKHVFMEKPIAVDPAGIRSVEKSGIQATQKNLSVMSGLQYRKQDNYVYAVEKIQKEVIGQPLSAHAEYLTGTIWYHERTPEMTEMEWLIRNWYYHTWLSGDFIVEQFIHNMDTMIWALGELPVHCTGMGARQQRTDSKFGNIYDMFAVEYEFPHGVTLTARCRQMDRTWQRVANRVTGSKGRASITPSRSEIEYFNREDREIILQEGESPNTVQQRRLIESIRDGTPVNETEQALNATLMAIMGREAAYTGQMLTWDQVYNASQDLTPESIDFNSPVYDPVAEPGVTQLNRTRHVADF
ncbi:Gfo/Idh/MocA family oxidoreductase [Balneolales bacterium ANBcel1]|nr:Gfo/Idh/MocA family oxidoreductase [Balneolales bacterium ANBcel1]